MADLICSIRRAGIRPDGRAQLDLKADSGEFDWSWFLTNAERGREVLATALVAITNDKKVEVTLPDPPQAWSEIQAFFLLK